MSGNRKTKDLFSSAHQQMMFSYFLGSRTSITEWLLHKANIAVTNTLSSSILLAFGMELIYSMNIPLVNLGQLSWLGPIPRSCPSPAYWWEWNLEETEPWCSVSAAQQQPKQWFVICSSVLSAPSQLPVQSPALWGLLGGISTSAQPDPLERGNERKAGWWLPCKGAIPSHCCCR